MTCNVDDSLENTRPVYYANMNSGCGGSTSEPVVQSKLDYYPYGKILREYHQGDKEKYQTTQHERDQETGLD